MDVPAQRTSSPELLAHEAYVAHGIRFMLEDAVIWLLHHAGSDPVIAKRLVELGLEPQKRELAEWMLRDRMGAFQQGGIRAEAITDVIALPFAERPAPFNLFELAGT